NPRHQLLDIAELLVAQCNLDADLQATSEHRDVVLSRRAELVVGRADRQRRLQARGQQTDCGEHQRETNRDPHAGLRSGVWQNCMLMLGSGRSGAWVGRVVQDTYPDRRRAVTLPAPITREQFQRAWRIDRECAAGDAGRLSAKRGPWLLR